MSYVQRRTMKILLAHASNKLVTAIQHGVRSSVYNAHVTAAELNSAQCIILALFYALITSDLAFCQVLQELLTMVEQLQSPNLTSWLREDFQFKTSDVLKVLTNLAHLVRGQHLSLPDYVLRVFVGLNTKYGIIDICKKDKDLETFYFLASVNVPCSRSQQTDPITMKKGNYRDSGIINSDCSLKSCSSSVSNESKCKGTRASRAKSRTWDRVSTTSPFAANFVYEPKSSLTSRYSTSIPDLRSSILPFSTSIEYENKGPLANQQLFQPIINMKKGNYRDSGIINSDCSLKSCSSSVSNESKCKGTRASRAKSRTWDRGRALDKSRTRRPSRNQAEQVVELSPELLLVQNFLSIPGPVSISEIRRYASRRDKRGQCSLHRAARGGLLAVLKALLNLGIPVDSRDNEGLTPAHYSAQEGCIESLELFKQYKADLTAVGNSGTTLLHLAAWKNKAKTCEWLLDNGCDIAYQGFKGRTALHCAAMWGHINTVSLLLDRGAPVHIKDYYKYTAYNLASSQGHQLVANLINAKM